MVGYFYIWANLYLMKYLVLLFSLVAISIFAQPQLPLDENKKVTYQDIIKTDSSITSYQLLNNAEKWVEKNMDLTAIDADKKTITGTNEFWTYSQKGVLQRTTGKITHDVSIELKEGKYRYTFNNFVYHYYITDRYNKFGPTGQKKPLEDLKAPGWTKLWNKHKYAMDNNMKAYIEDLKKSMIVVPKSVEEVKKEEQQKVKLKEEW